MSHDLRIAKPTDVPAIEAVVRAAYAPYVPRIGREPGPMLDDYAALVREGRVHVATRSDEGDHGCEAIEGVLVLIPEASAMLLDNLAVAPAAQGRGLGRWLVAFAERETLRAGLPVLRLYTNAAMSENLALYRRMGFQETNRAEDRGFRRVYMSKALT